MNFDETAMWERLQGKPGNYYMESAEPEREEFRKWTKSLLLERKIIIEFVKADGTVRAMICTLNEQFGAKYAVNESAESAAVEGVTKPVKVNNDVQKVWDCEASAWRSFRWDRLKRMQFSL